MGHLLNEFIRFGAAFFGHWQTWLSGSGIGGFIVIILSLREKLTSKGLSKKQYVYLFVVLFFLCSCFLAWVDADDALRNTEQAKSVQHAEDLKLLEASQAEFSELKSQCRYQTGVVDTLRKQNGDQQISINSCTDRAISLLTPVALQITPVMTNSAIPDQNGKIEGDQHVAMFVLETNKTLQDVKITVKCNHPLTGGRASPLREGAFVTQPIENLQSDGSLLVGYDAPAFTLNNPVAVAVSYKGDANTISCTFAPQGSA